MSGCWRSVLLGMLIAGAGAFLALAQDCPGTDSGKSGFVVERGVQRTEVVHDGANVRTLMRVSGSTLLERRLFEGLFELERVDRGVRELFQPKSDLQKLFPLRPGRRVTAEFEFRPQKGSARKLAVSLIVLNPEDLEIGRCKYRVLKIERRESWPDRTTRLANTDYYSPDLKFVLAKEFPQRDGSSYYGRFDKIYPLRR
jgi:hypothetical protein